MEKKIEIGENNGKSVKEIFGNISVVSYKTGEENKEFTKKMLEKYIKKFQ